MESPKGQPPSEDQIGLARDRDKWHIILNVPQCQQQGSRPEFCSATTWYHRRKHCWQGWGLGIRCRCQNSYSEGDALWIPSHWTVLKDWRPNKIVLGGLFENEFEEVKDITQNCKATPTDMSRWETVFPELTHFKEALTVNLTKCSFWGVKLLAASLQGPDSPECNCLPFFLPNIALLLLCFLLFSAAFLVSDSDLDRREVPGDLKKA